MQWILTYQKETKTLSDWGLSGLKRTRLNFGADRLILLQPQASLEAEFLFPPEAWIQVQCDGMPWFSGRLLRSPTWATAKEELFRYEFVGPWWFLENIIYQQSWHTPKGGDLTQAKLDVHNKSRVVLGQSEVGESISMAQALTHILDYAKQANAPLNYTLPDLPWTFPWDETKDISCAEAIHRILRWVPDATTSFDYTQPIPLLQIRRRSKAPAISLSLKNQVQQLEITPRPDLQLAGVIIKYEKNHSESHFFWKTLEIDAYPQKTDEQNHKTLVLTQELYGYQGLSLEQKIEVESIELGSVDWWKRHIPVLMDIPSRKIKILSTQRQTNLPNFLVSGTISPLMSVTAESELLQVSLAYEEQSGSLSQQPFALKVIATDAKTQTYRLPQSYLIEETTPQGLAEQLYRSLSFLPYEGKLVLITEGLAPLSLAPGILLSLKEGRKEWESMQAVVQTITEDVSSGQVTIHFGPPKHLSADDFLAIASSHRRRGYANSAAHRYSGDRWTSIGQWQKKHYTAKKEIVPGVPLYQSLILKDVAANKQIVLSTKEAKTKNEIKLREELVFADGKVQKRLILASEPYVAT